MKTMDLILIIVGALVVAFTVEMIIIFRRYAMVPDELIRCFYAAMAGECGIMGWIKTAKVKQQDREWEEKSFQRFKDQQEERR